MALDPSTLLSRTTAGDAELSTPTNGLSLGQRKVLTYLEAPQALEELVAQRALDAAKLDRDLGKLAALGLVAINGQRSPIASEAVVIGPVRSTSMLRWLIPLLLLAGGVIAWLGFAGTASRKPATTAISVAATTPPPAAATTTGDAAAAGSTSAGVADPRALATEALAGRNLSPAIDTRRGGDPRATTAAPGAIARQPAAPAAADSPPSGATARAGNSASSAAGAATEASSVPARPAPVAASAAVVAAVPSTQGAGTASARNAADASGEGRAAQPADARNDTNGKADAGRAAGASPGNPTPATKAAPSGVASASTNAAAAGSAATAPAPAGASTPPITLAMAAPSSAEAHPEPQQRLVPLTRETPEFPREALSRGVVSGTVKARLTIDATGKVTAVSIVDARPTRVFDRAVTQALSRWTFAAGDASRSTEVEIAFKRD